VCFPDKLKVYNEFCHHVEEMRFHEMVLHWRASRKLAVDGYLRDSSNVWQVVDDDFSE